MLLIFHLTSEDIMLCVQSHSVSGSKKKLEDMKLNSLEDRAKLKFNDDEGC